MSDSLCRVDDDSSRVMGSTTTAESTTTTAPPPPAEKDGNEEEEDDDDCLNLPPGRLHVPRGLLLERLSPAITNSTMRKKLTESTGGTTPRSRSRSPSLSRTNKTTTTGATAPMDANSSISSLEEFIDQDILYDRQGFVESDLSAESQQQQRKLLHNSREFVNLPPVSERMSDESLEDVHAFSDLVVRSSNASRVSIGTGTDAVLEPLDECCDEDENDDELDDGLDDILEEEEPTTVILTNMENLNLVSESRERTGGESSYLGEAPSGPTA